ncbi:hypothetical protein AB833_19625 [Chromatiales bacterium (ex Bugula neritina AB1)]|nr:hypothetical protein AB833_19625 [Chromatiales bacterium (ex Bugula neritina AB1)]
MFLLAGREHGRLELRQKLVQRQYPPPLIDSVLDELAERGLQCDVRFAESYTRMRVNRGYGANKIRADLQAKKLTRDIVEQAIIENDADWDENAHAALIKKFAVSDCIEMPDNYKEKVAYIGKMTRFLQARGYGSQQIAEALKRVSTRTA